MVDTKLLAEEAGRELRKRIAFSMIARGQNPIPWLKEAEARLERMSKATRSGADEIDKMLAGQEPDVNAWDLAPLVEFAPVLQSVLRYRDAHKRIRELTL